MPFRPKLSISLLLLSGVVLAGCAGPTHDALSYESRRLPYTEVGKDRNYSFFYATSRSVSGSGSDTAHYGNETDDHSTVGTYAARLSPRFDAKGNKPEVWTGTEISRLQNWRRWIFTLWFG